jgi:hypothetical protein
MLRRGEPPERRITRLVRELIGGKPVSQVSLDDIPAVTNGLQASLSAASAQRRRERVQRIEILLADLDSYEARRRPKSTRHENSNPNIEAPTPTAVIDSVLEDFVSGIPHDIAETPMIPQLTDRAKQIINELLAKGEYQRAQHYEDVHRDLSELMALRRVEDQRRQRIQSIVNQIEDCRSKLESEVATLKQLLADCDERSQCSFREEQEKWADEMAKFDIETAAALPPCARKFSSRLLNLREQERFLICSRRYQDAAGIKDDADALEARELAALRVTWLRKRDAQKANMSESHEQRVKCMRAKAEATRSEIERSGEERIRHWQLAIENLQGRLGSADCEVVVAPTHIRRRHESMFVTQAEVSRPGTARKRTVMVPNRRPGSRVRRIANA